MSNSQYDAVGVTVGNPKPRVLPCGHVELLPGYQFGTTDFKGAVNYYKELQSQLQNAMRQARDFRGCPIDFPDDALPTGEGVPLSDIKRYRDQLETEAKELAYKCQASHSRNAGDLDGARNLRAVVDGLDVMITHFENPNQDSD